MALRDPVRRKLERCEILGVQEYWVVDPARSAARVYRRSGKRLQAIAELTATVKDVLTSPLFPGLEIPLLEQARLTEMAARGLVTLPTGLEPHCGVTSEHRGRLRGQLHPGSDIVSQQRVCC